MIQPIRVALNFSTPNSLYKVVSELQSSAIEVQDIVFHIMKNLIGTQSIPKDYFVDLNFTRKYAGQQLKNGDNIYIRVNQVTLDEWIKPLKQVQEKRYENNFNKQKTLENTAQTKDLSKESPEQMGQRHIEAKQYEQLRKRINEKNKMPEVMQFKLQDITIGQKENEDQRQDQSPKNAVAKQKIPNKIDDIQNPNQRLLKNASQQNQKINQQKELPAINPAQPNKRNLNQLQAKQNGKQDTCCRII